MKEVKFKKSKIVTWVLFIIVSIILLYESVVPEKLSLVNQIGKFANRVVEFFNPVEVIPVERIEIVNKKDEVQSGKTFRLEYKVYPSNATDKSVIIKNLSPEVTKFYHDKHEIYCIDTKEERAKASFEITSQANPNIKVDYNFDVINYAPDQIVLHETSLDKNGNTYIIKANQMIFARFDALFDDPSIRASLTKLDITTSPNIERLNRYYYYAKSEGESFIRASSRVNPEIYQEIKFKVSGILEETSLPTEIKFRTSKNDPYLNLEHPLVDTIYQLELFNNQEINKIPYVILGNDQFKYQLQGHYINFKENGNCKFDFYFPTLDEHLVKEIKVHHVYKEPTFIGESKWDQETLTIDVEVKSANTIKIKWPKEATNQVFVVKNGSNRFFKVDATRSYITIKGLEAGSSYFDLVSKQGEGSDQTPLKYRINVNVKKSFIDDQREFNTIIRKSFGHMLGFLLDGLLLTILLYLYHDEKKPLLFMMISIPTGFLAGGLSELLQMIPKRGTCIRDVGIDYLGWIIGVSIAYLVLTIRILVKKHQEKNKNKTTNE